MLEHTSEPNLNYDVIRSSENCVIGMTIQMIKPYSVNSFFLNFYLMGMQDSQHCLSAFESGSQRPKLF